MRKVISIALCLIMVLGTFATAFADTSQGTATTLRLEKTEGKVGITKTGGKSVTVKDGVRLYDGYEIKTDKKSAAYISLDSSKAIMLDASTDVSIKKNGKKLEVMLKSGTVLVNVEDKLKGDEELNIRTTNSVTGIRGTILQASYIPQTGNTELYLFEGATTGKYLAPDGTWYTQELTTGSWLASGIGMLSDHPDFNGWKQVEGHWVYTNNSIEGTVFQNWCWSAEQGWYTLDTQTGEITKQEAWPFSFKDLAPKTQLEILGDGSMLERGQEHLDLYPELAEDKLPETKAAAEEALAEQQAEIEKKDAAIQEVFEEGNGGNSVDNLFAESSAPSVPRYAVHYYQSADAAGSAEATPLRTVRYAEGQTITPPADLLTGYELSDWMYNDPAGGGVTPLPAVMGTTAIDCWPTTVNVKTYHVSFDVNGGTAVNDLGITDFTYDNEDLMLPDVMGVFSNAGYGIYGWALTPTGVPILNLYDQFANAQDEIANNADAAGNITLYALWKPVTAITINAVGAFDLNLLHINMLNYNIEQTGITYTYYVFTDEGTVDISIDYNGDYVDIKEGGNYIVTNNHAFTLSTDTSHTLTLSSVDNKVQLGFTLPAGVSVNIVSGALCDISQTATGTVYSFQNDGNGADFSLTAAPGVTITGIFDDINPTTPLNPDASGNYHAIGTSNYTIETI